MITEAESSIPILDVSVPQKVQYCIPNWLRDEQVKWAIQNVKGRICEIQPKRPEPVAVICFGPSLADTWEKVRDFQFIFSCSGAHKFLVDRGIIPNWHVEVDPRPHKVELIGQPQRSTQYLLASACHRKVFEHLADYDVRLWHVFSTEEESLRILPRGEWAITGGCSVGLRTLTMARYFGFTDIHLFGMDGSEGATGKHAAFHPNSNKKHALVEYPKESGIFYKTTPAILEAATQTFHELNMLKDCKATFYGYGLVQAMAKDYIPEPHKGNSIIGMSPPELISAEYRALNAKLHTEHLAYGVGGGKHADTVLKLATSIKTHSILDYGCGKGYLAKAISFPIWEYDPAIPAKSDLPRPANLVVCTDVLEHIEPQLLNHVLADLRRCTKQIGFFVIHTRAAQKVLPDGRNTHLIQQGKAWWKAKLRKFFTVARIFEAGPELYIIVAPLQKPKLKEPAAWKN